MQAWGRRRADEKSTKRGKMKTGGDDVVRGLVTALYQRNQRQTAPDQKGHDQKDKEARCEQFATGMRGWRKVKTIIRFARSANRRLRCSFSAQSTGSQGKHGGEGGRRGFHCSVSF